MALVILLISLIYQTCKKKVKQRIKAMKIITLISFFMSLSAISASSPFTDVKYEALPSVTVEVEEQDYYLLNIEGIKRAEIMSKCEARYAQECKCMFAEKFSVMMNELGYSLTNPVNVKLYKMQGHQIKTVSLQMTEENTESILDNRFTRNELCY